MPRLQHIMTLKMFNPMKQFKSVSEKRLIVDCIINSIHAYFLIDTGASIGLIDDNKMNRYKLVKGKKYN